MPQETKCFKLNFKEEISIESSWELEQVGQAQCILDLPYDKYRMETEKEVKWNNVGTEKKQTKWSSKFDRNTRKSLLATIIKGAGKW